MERSEVSYETNLPGYDALHTVYHQPPTDTITEQDLKPYDVPFGHRVYLENPDYHRYLRMHKVLVGERGAQELDEIGTRLSDEKLPRYLDAAGWAFAESAIAAENETTVHRVAKITYAEELWQKALQGDREIEAKPGNERFIEEAQSFRLALNLAYAPLMKAIVVGNVTDSVRQRVFQDTLAITQMANVHLNLAKAEGDKGGMGDLFGFIQEGIALMSMLYLNDPRYVPLPSSSKADSGYYHPDQTHDITVINQHWGNIKKILPVEIKSAPTLKEKNRFKALMIRGKMHLIIGDRYSATDTINAFTNVFEHSIDKSSQQIVDHAAMTVRELMTLYQKGDSAEGIASRSLTHFHRPDEVEKMYPELSRESSLRRGHK